MGCGIIGASSTGKTIILLNILACILLPENIYLCSKTAYQEKYGLLNMANSRNLKIHTIDDVNDLSDPNDVPEESITISDYILTENQH